MKRSKSKTSRSAISPALYSSNKMDWETPRDLFDKLDAEFHFTLDVCANVENAKCRRFFSKKENGLSKSWKKDVCWMNPPYGWEIGLWMAKAYQESLEGATVVCLVPSRTDTKWWHDYAMRGHIRFIKGRVRFGDGKNCAPFPSAIVVFTGIAVVHLSPLAKLWRNSMMKKSLFEDALRREEQATSEHPSYVSIMTLRECIEAEGGGG